MKTEFKLNNKPLKLYLSVGFFATVIVIFFAIYFSPIVWGFAVIVGAFAVVRLVMVVDRYWLDRKQLVIAIRKDEFQGQWASIPNNHKLLMDSASDVKIIEGAIVAPKLDALALPEPEDEKLDFVSAFTQPQQAYAVIAGQQVGKTTTIQPIVKYWRDRADAEQPIVIGPKWRDHEWAGCLKHGGKGDYDAVQKGLDGVYELAMVRHEKGESNVPQPVFVDDWTPIVKEIPDVERFMISATTLFASAGVVLYFLIHSDTANAWGVGKTGAALKDNFVKLFIEATRDRRTGKVLRHLNQGYIQFPGDKERMEVELPKFSDEKITKFESEVVKLHREGKSYRHITNVMWGDKHGQYYNEKVDSILKKRGEL